MSEQLWMLLFCVPEWSDGGRAAHPSSRVTFFCVLHDVSDSLPWHPILEFSRDLARCLPVCRGGQSKGEPSITLKQVT